LLPVPSLVEFAGPVVVACLFSVGLSGQVRLSGRVTDENVAPVAGARITVSPAGSAKNFEGTSDPTGAFLVALPGAGTYSVKVDREGFYVHTEASLRIPETSLELQVALQTIHELQTRADVTDQPGIVDMERTSSQETLSSKTLFDIPFPNQNSLRSGLRMLPSVVQDSAGGLHLFGGAESQAQYTFEGFELNDPLTGRFDARMSLESVKSVDVSAQSGGETGRGEAGTMAIHARTGGDELKFSATNVFPGIDTGRGVKVGSWTPRGDISGPWKKGKAWFFNTTEFQFVDTLVPGLPAGQDRQMSYRVNDLLHNQVNLTSRNILFIGLLFNYYYAPRNGLTVLDPRTTTVDRRSNQWFGYVKDQHSFSRSALMEVGFASSRTFSRETPQGTSAYLITPTGRLGNNFTNGKRDGRRQQLLTNIYLPAFRFAGVHQFKTGADLVLLDYAQNIRRNSIEYVGLDGTVLRQVDFVGSGSLSRSNIEHSVYVQDSWKIRSSLLVELGLRTDHDQLLKNWNLSPRAGIAWSPEGLAGVRVSAGVGVMYNPTDLRLYTRPLDQYTASTFFNAAGQVTSGPLAAVYMAGRDLEDPRAMTYNLGAERTFPKLIQLKMQLLHRRTTEGFSYQNIFQPGAPLPPGLNFPGNPAQLGTIYALGNGREDKYDSAEITIRQPLKGRYDWMASYTRSRALSNIVIDRSIDQPLMVGNNSGPLPWDAPNRFVHWAYLPTPLKDWAVAYLLDWRSGFPFSVQDQFGQLVGRPDDHRFGQFFELNLFAERQFTLRGYRLALRGGFNNITGHQNSNVVDNVVGGPTFLRQYGGQSRALNFRLRLLGKG
jgi:Carboxypeptidase regulatory-like domain